MRRPNILFAIADDASWMHFSAYGCRFVKTPNFDRVAREGALFNNVFAEYLLTGLVTALP